MKRMYNTQSIFNFLLHHRRLIIDFIISSVLITSCWMLAHINVSPIPQMYLTGKLFVLVVPSLALYWFCFHVSQEEPETVRTFCYAYAFPLVVLLGLLLPAEMLKSSQAPTSEMLTGYAIKFQNFALEAIPEFYGFLGLILILIIIEGVAISLNFLFGIPFKTLLFSKITDIPVWYKKLVVVGILKGIGIEQPYRTYFYYITGTLLFLTAKTFTALAGGATAIAIVLFFFPHPETSLSVSNFLEVWAVFNLILSIGGMGAALEIAWHYCDLNSTKYR